MANESLYDLRSQVASAAAQGFLDADLAAELDTARTNGFIDNGLRNESVGGVIGGVNR